jgi:hypothetical protein
LKHGSGVFRVTGLLWQLLIGSPACPGIAILVRSAIESKPLGYLKIRATLKGRFLAWFAIAKSLLYSRAHQVPGDHGSYGSRSANGC